MDNKVSYKIISWDEFSHPEEVNQPSKTSPQMVSTSLKGLHISAQLDFDQGKFEELELIFKYLFYWRKQFLKFHHIFLGLLNVCQESQHLLIFLGNMKVAGSILHSGEEI